MMFTKLQQWWKQSTKASKEQRAAGRRSRGRCMLLSLERLEDRTLLSVTFPGVPNWVAEGPAPITDGGTVASGGNVIGPTLAPPFVDGSLSLKVGAINAIAVDPNPTNANHLFAATVNGGIWQTSDCTAATPTWTTTTDLLPSLAISSVAFSPVNSNVIYAGTGSYSSIGGSFRSAGRGGGAVGVYKSSDGGATWQILNPNGMYTGLRILRVIPTTLNAGQTVLLATTDTNQDAFGFTIGGGVYRSDDGGGSWTRLSGANSLPNVGVTDLVENPNNANQFFAAVPASLSGTPGVFRLDLGVNTTWANVANNITVGDLNASLRIELSVSPAGANPVWASIINQSRFYQRIYRGVAGGGTVNWTQVGPPSSGVNQPPDVLAGNQGNLHGAIVADPTADNLVYVSGDSIPSTIPRSFAATTGYIARGNSTANTWTAITPNGSASGDPGTAVPTSNNVMTSPHADTRGLVFASGGLLILSCDGGVYAGTNPSSTTLGAQTWISINGTLQNTEFYNIAYDSQFHIILGGTQDNGTVSQNAQDSISSYHDESGGDGGATAVDSFTLAGMGGSVRYIYSAVRKQYSGAATRITGDIDAGIFPQAGLPGFVGFTGSVVNAIAPTAAQLAAGQSTRVVIAGGTNATTTVGAVYESSDAGSATESSVVIGGRTVYFVNDTWTNIPTDPTFVSVNQITSNTDTDAVMVYGGRSGGGANRDVLYAASGSKIFLRAGVGGVLTQTPQQPAGAGSITAIALDSNDWTTAFVTDNSQVFMTTDAGANWTSIMTPVIGNLTNPAGSNARLAVIAGSGIDAVLFGGSNGVFRMLTTAPGVWTKYGAGLPNASIGGMVYNKTDDVLVVGTYGRGAWEIASASRTAFAPGSMLVSGDDTGVTNDTIVLRLDPAIANLIQVVVNNQVQYDGPFAIFSSITIDGGAGHDTINIEDVPLGVPVTTVEGDTGIVNIGKNGSLQGINGLVAVTNPNSNTTLNIDDSGDSTAQNFIIGTNPDGIWGYVHDTALPRFNVVYRYADTSSLRLNTGTASGNVVGIYENGVPTNVVGYGPATAVNIGDGFAGVQSMLAPVTIWNVSGLSNAIRIDDSADRTAQDFIIGTNADGIWGYVHDTAQLSFNVIYKYANTSGLTLNTGRASGNVVGVWENGVPTTLNVNDGTVYVGDGNVGLAAVQGTLTVNSTATDTVILDLNDQADATGRTVTLASGRVSGLAPADIHYGQSALANLNINGSTRANTFIVQSTPVPVFVPFVGIVYTNTNINCSGADTVNVGDANGVQDILGPLTVNSTLAHAVNLNLNDQADATGPTVTLASGNISGLAPVDINYGQFALANLIINGGSGGNTFDVESTQAGTATTVNAGSGDDTIKVSPDANNLVNIAGPLTVNGEGGANTLTINDQATRTLQLSSLTDRTLTRSGAALITYTMIANLTVNTASGGPGLGVFFVTSTLAGTTVTLTDGGSGAMEFIDQASLNGIQGPLIVHGRVSNPDFIVLNDAGNTARQDYTLTANGGQSTVRRGGMAPITFDGQFGLDFYASPVAGTTVNVQSSASNMTTGIWVGGGVLVTIGSQAPLLGGTLANILGLVTILPIGVQPCSVILDDSADTTGRQATFNTEGPYYGVSGLSGPVAAPTRIEWQVNPSATIRILGGSGGNTFNVESTQAGTATTINGGTGGSTINVSPIAHLLSNIAGALTVNGQGGTSTLNVNDQGTSSPKAYEIYADAVKRVLRSDPPPITFDAVINYANIGTLIVNGGSGGNAFFVEGTAAGVNTTINGGGGSPPVPEAFVIRAENNALFGPLALHERPGNSFVRYDDQADPTAQTYTLAAGSLSRSGLAPVTYDNVNAVSLLSATVGGNTINVVSTSAGTPVAISAGGGGSTINLSPVAHNLANLAGLVNINGQGGTNTLNAFDQATTFSPTGQGDELYQDHFTRIDPSERTVFTYGGIQSVNVSAGRGDGGFEAFFVSGTPAGVPVTVANASAGSVEFFVSGNSTLDMIQGPVTLHGRVGGSDYLVLHDGVNPNPQTFTVTANTVSRSGIAPIFYDNQTQLVLYTSIQALAMVNVQSTAPGAFTQILLRTAGDQATLNAPNIQDLLRIASGGIASGGAVSVTVDDSGDSRPRTATFTTDPDSSFRYLLNGLAPGRIFLSLDPGSSMHVLGGSGGNTFNVQGTLAGAALAIDGGSGTNTLQGPDSDTTWQLTGTNAGSFTGGVSFTGMEYLTGGAGADRFVFADGAAVSGTINGGSGTNTLDYSAYSTSVIVDLRMNAATGVGGSVLGIRNVTGGNGNGALGAYNLLIGNGGNTLTGGFGRRNLLVAGGSASTLLAGDGEDLLIGGTTMYDNLAGQVSWQAIAAYWAGPDAYAMRVANLTSGNGVPRLDPTTVTGNGGGNTLRGNGALGLIFSDGLDTILNFDPNSIIIPIAP